MENHLNPEQTEKLVQFQELSGIEDLNACKEILEQHFWNVESAIHDHLSFDTGPITRPIFNSPPVHQNNQLNGVQNSQNTPGRIPAGSNASFIRRIMTFFFNPFLEEVDGGRPQGFIGWILFISSLPIRITLTICTPIMHLSSYIFKLLKPDLRQALTDPVGDVVSFISEYDNTYGTNHPTFFVGTYSQVLNEAKKELKFLIVYLHSKDHQDTDRFCNQTLSNQDVIEYINRTCLMWACSVNTTEGSRVSQTLRENTYPFVAVIVQREYKMTVVGRVEGFLPPDRFLQRVQAIVSDNEAFLIAVRADREERSFNQALRQEQDEAYQESLRADREKEEKRRLERQQQEELERQQIEKEQSEQRIKEELIQRKIDAVLLVPEEPRPEESSKCCRILVRLPSGQKLERRFHRTLHTLNDLYHFILAHPDSPYRFEMVTSFPKRSLPWSPNEDSYPTLTEIGFGASETLLVLDLDA
nr:EOG090X0B12 [Leptodora kindtii]